MYHVIKAEHEVGPVPSEEALIAPRSGIRLWLGLWHQVMRKKQPTIKKTIGGVALAVLGTETTCPDVVQLQCGLMEMN